MRAFSLSGRLALLLWLAAALLEVLPPHYALPLALLLLLLPLWWLAARILAPLLLLLRALETSVASFRDGEFSVGIALRRRDELGALIEAHNALGDALRRQRQHLVQRELLLDTVVQHTPLALLLVDDAQRVVLVNVAARRLLGSDRAAPGSDLESLLRDLPAPLLQAFAQDGDSVFAVNIAGVDEAYQLIQRGFQLQSRPHRLYLLRRMTRELAGAEAAVWKKVIRVISHELNNSLAPISSLAHSGSTLAQRGDRVRLEEVFARIGERVRHLHGFIAGYGKLARLPAPRLEPVAWAPFLAALAAHADFRMPYPPPPRSRALFDAAQMEQVLLNLIKNAHESGSRAEAIELEVQPQEGNWRIEVRDRGPGVSDAVLTQALLPFFSTRRGGSGLGLALAREIVEAHGGRIALINREGGGLCVRILLPGSAMPLA